MRRRRYQQFANACKRSASDICAVLLVLCLPANAQTTESEYQVKAAYIYDFAKMSQWPITALPADSALVIGVSGADDDFIKVLRPTLSGKIIDGHTLEIRRLRSPEEVRFCNLVFFRASEPATRNVIEHLGNSSILLVGEDNDFLSRGGMIKVAWVGGKFTYEINSEALQRAGLHFGDDSSAKSQSGPDSTEVQEESSRSIKFRVAPEYPRIAASLKIVGAVQLQAVVRADGTVKQVRVVGGHPALAQAAAAAVMHWRYGPAAKETTETVRVTFGD